MPVNLPGHEGVDTSLGTGLHLEHRHRTASFLDMDLPPLHMSFIPNTNPGVIDNVMTSMQHNSKYNLAYILLINLSKSRDQRKKNSLDCVLLDTMSGFGGSAQNFWCVQSTLVLVGWMSSLTNFTAIWIQLMADQQYNVRCNIAGMS